MRFAYADPPYPGCAHMYPENTEVPLGDLIGRLERDYPDGWAVSTHVRGVLEVAPLVLDLNAKIASWGRTQAPLHPPLHFVSAWEPVIFRTSRRYDGGRPALDSLFAHTTNRGFMAKRHGQGLTGAKPRAFCEWILDLLGFRPGDQLDDIFPGTGIMGKVARARTRQRNLSVTVDAPTEASA